MKQQSKPYIRRRLAAGLLLIFFALSFTACNQIRLPRIDPFGRSVFLPGESTTLATNGPGCLQRLCNRQTNTNATLPPGSFPILGGPQFNVPVAPVPVAPVPVTPVPAIVGPQAGLGFGTPMMVQPQVVVPQLPGPAVAPPCDYQGAIGSCLELRRKARELGVPAKNPNKLLRRGERGELVLTPSKIVAPVGSEVIVMAGICGTDGYLVPHQPLEFMLSQDSVGQMVDYSSRQTSRLGQLVKHSNRKTSGDFLNLITSMKEETIDRGTPTPVDDIHIEKGQAWVSVSSASPGNSYITAVAPKSEAWDKRLRSMEIQWIDALWNIPTPVTATAGAKYPLTTNIRQTNDGLGVDNWKVRYEIAGGAAAQFLPNGTQTAEVVTGPDGNATVEIQQANDQTGPGTTFIRVDIIRPANNSAGYEVIESAVTSVRWVAAALTIRAIGPKNVATGSPFNYRLEVTNPGDQVARESTVTLQGLPEGLTFVSSSPKPTEYGDRYVWSLGDVPPGADPNVIDIQFKSESAVGVARLCFEAGSQVDLLKTTACAETQVVAPCLGVQIDGDRQGRVGEQTTFKLTFVNQCEQDLRGIRAQVTYDAGLEAVGKSGPISFGPMQEALAFGESKTLDLTFRLREEGTHCFRVDIQAEGGHTASLRRCITSTNVNQPALTMEMAAQSNATIDQPLRVTARVTNTGNVPLTNVIVRTEASPSLEPVNALPQAFADNGLVSMQVDRLEPGSFQNFTVEYRTLSIDGNGFARFQVQSDQGIQDLKEVPIRIVGRDGSINSPPPAAGNQGPIGIPGNPSDPSGGLIPGRDPNLGGNPNPVNPNPVNPNTGVNPNVLGQLSVQMKTVSPVVRREEPFDTEILVTNQRQNPDQNIRVQLQTPPGVVLMGLVDSPYQALSSPDQLQHEFPTIVEIRSGETITFRARMRATQLGTPRVEVSAVSAASAVPVSTSLDLSVSQ